MERGGSWSGCEHLPAQQPVRDAIRESGRDIGIHGILDLDPTGAQLVAIPCLPAGRHRAFDRVWVVKMFGPLDAAHIVTEIPAQDLDRARRFYGDRLGLEPG